MGQIKLKEARLHNSFIINGKNFKDVVNTTTTQDLEMVYDFDSEREVLMVTYKGLLKLIPISNVSDMTPLEQKVKIEEPKNEHPTPPPRGKVKAQVGGPTVHVFEGPKPI